MEGPFKRNFFKMPHQVIAYSRFWGERGILTNLPRSSVLLYVYLCHKVNRLRTDNPYHSDDIICFETGLSRTTLYRARKELCEVGLIGYCPGYRGHATVYNVAEM